MCALEARPMPCMFLFDFTLFGSWVQFTLYVGTRVGNLDQLSHSHSKCLSKQASCCAFHSVSCGIYMLGGHILSVIEETTELKVVPENCNPPPPLITAHLHNRPLFHWVRMSLITHSHNTQYYMDMKVCH